MFLEMTALKKRQRRWCDVVHLWFHFWPSWQGWRTDRSGGGTLPCIETNPHLAADAASWIPHLAEMGHLFQLVLKPWKSCPLFSVYFFPQRSGMILIQHLEELILVYQVCIRHLTVPHLPKGFHETPFQNHCLKWSCFKPL